MPTIAWPRSIGAQVASELQLELQDPAPKRLVRNIQAAFCEEFLSVAVDEREAQIEPDGVADDVGREPVAALEDRRHIQPDRLSRWPSALP